MDYGAMNYEYRTRSGCRTEFMTKYMIKLPGIYLICYGAKEGDKELVSLKI